MIEEASKTMRNFLLMIYEDECRVMRSHELLQANGTIQREYAEISSGIACRLSRMLSRRAVLDDDLPQSKIQSDARLYVDINEDFLPGDRISVVHREEEHVFDCAEVYKYPSHIECALTKVVEA